MNKENKSILKIIGTITIIFGVVYAVLGTLSITGTIAGMFLGLEEKDLYTVCLLYITLLVTILSGITNIKEDIEKSKVFAGILILVGLISLIYTLVAAKTMNNFDCITIVLGIGTLILVTLEEKEKKKIAEILKQKKDKEKKEKRKTKKKNTK